MAQQWIVKRPQASSGTGPPPVSDVLPNAILGTPVLTTSFSTDENHQFLIAVSIPISWPSNNWADVDRLIVHLYAPDTAVDTQEGFVGGPGTGGTTAGQETPGIVIGDAANASKIVSIESSAVLIEKPWDPKRPFLQFEYPAPTQDEWWRAVVVSASPRQKNRVDTSPSIRLHVTPQGADVLGVEYAPLALNFHLVNQAGAVIDQPLYDTAEGGSPTWGFIATWENDVNDPRYPILGGYDIVIEYPDGGRETTTSKSSNDTRHESPMWIFGADGDFTVWCVSWSSQAGNKRNTIVAGTRADHSDRLTPGISFRVTRQVGTGAHGEFADNVLNPRLVSAPYNKTSSGQKVLQLMLAWDEPDDRRYQGVVIEMKRGDGVVYVMTGVTTTPEITIEMAQFPIAAESVDLRFRSVSTDGYTNSYVAGFPGNPDATPVLTLLLQPPAETTPDVTVPNVSIVYGKDEFGGNTYGYSATWVNPNKSQYPEYQGIKIFKADAAGTAESRVALSGIEIGQAWKSDMWPLMPATAIYIYFVSVDVNGVEKDLLLAQKRGPLIISGQGGTINNANLPDIDVANFAAGIEPVAFINKQPQNGVIPSSVGDPSLRQAKVTTTVFNQYDQRMYRWKVPLAAVDGDAVTDSNGGYRVVGDAPDITFRSLTGAKIAVGAISSIQMAANEILVGPRVSGAPSDDRPPIFKVMKADNTSMVGFFGTYQGWEGIYALNMRIGPSFLSPTLEGSASGLDIHGDSTRTVSFQLDDSTGKYVKMSTSNIVFDGSYASIAASVGSAPDATEADLVSRGLVCYKSGLKYLALVKNPTYPAGELVIYGPDTGLNASKPNVNFIRVFITGIDEGVTPAVPRGIVRAERFDATFGGNGVSTGGLVSITKLNIAGGIIVGWA